MLGKTWNFPQKKFQKIVFPRNSAEFSAESDFPWKKMHEKSAPDWAKLTQGISCKVAESAHIFGQVMCQV
jgi:hypothetical protein